MKSYKNIMSKMPGKKGEDAGGKKATDSKSEDKGGFADKSVKGKTVAALKKKCD